MFKNGYALTFTLLCAMSNPVFAIAGGENDEVLKKDDVSVNEVGTVRIPATEAPFSDLSSDQAKHSFVKMKRAWSQLGTRARAIAKPGESHLQTMRRATDEFVFTPELAKLRHSFGVNIKRQLIGGVPVDVIEPTEDVQERNRNRILINLHGGGFATGGGLGGQLESVPIAAIGNFTVVSVDYRLAPEHRFPAASEDVASVYRVLLETYPAENVGIFGCSAGGILTAQAASWFQAHDLPRPGALGIFGAGALAGSRGDSRYFGPWMSGFRASREDALEYFNVPGLDIESRLVSPAFHPGVMAKFPPTLLVSGTRDIGLSSAAFTHARLLEAGTEASLYVVEGGYHCSFAGGVNDPDLPENKEVWRVISHFFSTRLGTASRHR